MFLCFGKYVFQGGDHNPTHLSTKRARPGNSRISRGPRALGAEARGDSTKNRTPSEIEEVCGLGSVRGIVMEEEMSRMEKDEEEGLRWMLFA